MNSRQDFCWKFSSTVTFSSPLSNRVKDSLNVVLYFLIYTNLVAVEWFFTHALSHSLLIH